ncbi:MULTISPECIES: TetR/AcrR family transcriptional regulator [Nocardiopsis]|uniref:AcrR family transcriptional regulator n=1 Tax=Nocardiopsis sinuspersici TaxID=501010 RepID=A0A1V3C794_9ACTN|nr:MULTISPECIES: TetR/AcrR family transcriptional regulator [Nocardiopsis]NYH53130.1 AcrR family transcriptional regulator [Nocardiopsis sinuspersici]OOC56502.1 TetR family transcriptional regulator [Nocardiopsis sinuspersici]
MERSGGRGGQPRVATREVVLAAVRLFTESGFDDTTMDQIATATGVSRRSLFRRFGSKEDILFAEHDELFSTVVRYLEASPDEPLTSVFAAARLVLQGYLRDPEITVPRYRLVRAHPRLRDREVAMTARYQAAFSSYLSRCGDGGGREGRSLAAGVAAASLISAHNHVLRGWLRRPEQDSREVWAGFDEAMDFVRRAAEPMLHAERGPRRDHVLVAVYPGDTGREELLRRIGAAVQASEGS